MANGAFAVIAHGLRSGLSFVRARPGFSVIAVASLALGIGANSAIFAVVNATILNPLPWQHSERTVIVQGRRLQTGTENRALAAEQLIDLRKGTQSFEDVVGITGWAPKVQLGSDAVELKGARLTGDPLRLLGIKLALGRSFTPDDARPESEAVMVISHRVWHDRFGADPSIVGKRFTVDGGDRTVVGVLARDQWFPWPWTEALAPARLIPADPARRLRIWGALGLLREGVDIGAAQADVDHAMTQLSAAYPETDGGFSARLDLARNSVVSGQGRSRIWLLMASVVLVLLIACANVANLLVARGAGRSHEMATRAAVGATRWQLISQSFAETSVLALLALPVALALAWLLIRLLLVQVPDSVPYIASLFKLDYRVVLFTSAVTLFTLFAVGLFPAFYGTKLELSSVIKEGGGHGATVGRARRLRTVLVVLQIATAMIMLSGTQVAIESFLRQSKADPGFDSSHLLTARIALPDERYSGASDWRLFHHSLVERVRTIPGALHVSSINEAPFSFEGFMQEFTVMNKPKRELNELQRALYSNVEASYVDTLGLKLLRGRNLDARDSETAQPVALVNDSLAKQYFGDDSVLGARLRAEDMGTFEVVGVVSDISEFKLGGGNSPRIYVPYEQKPWHTFTLIVRTSGDPRAFAGPLRDAVASVDPRLPLSEVLTMDKRVERSLWQSRFFLVVMGWLSALALVLSAVGIYGIASYSVYTRTREIGIRLAIGAEPRQIALLMLRETVRLVAIGIAVGLLPSLGLNRGLSRVLYEVRGAEPGLVLVTALLLVVTAMLSSLWPLLSAARTAPADALRHE